MRRWTRDLVGSLTVDSGQSVCGLPTVIFAFMKKWIKIGFVLLLLLVLFRGWLFRLVVTYYPISAQQNYSVSDKKLEELLDNQPIGSNVENIIEQSLRLTANQLRFTSGKNFTDPNQLFYSKTAHCVGYAAFFNITCQALLRNAKLENQFRVKHLRGKLTLLGFDLHRLTNSPFFRDHDFNVVEDLQTGKKIYVDASLQDVLGIGYVHGE